MPENAAERPAAPPPEADKDWSLPPWAPFLIAAVLIAVGVYIFMHVTEAPPVAQAAITKVFAVEQPGQARVVVGIEVHIKNLSQLPLLTRTIDTKLVTASGQFLDQPAAAAEQTNYFRALPALKQSDAPPLGFETKIPVGGEVDGLLIVGYPVDKAAFDARQSLEVNIGLYGQKPLLLKK